MTTTTHAYDTADDRTTYDDVDGKAVLNFTRRAVAGDYPDLPNGLRHAVEAGGKIKDRTRALAADIPDEPTLAARILFDLAEGRPIDDALTAAVDAHLSRQRIEAEFNLLRLASSGAERMLRDTIRDHLPALMAVLRTRLDPCVAKLRIAYTALGDLDPHQPDPLDVAQATDKQRKALTTVAEQTREYRRIRGAQRDALAASSLPPIGSDPHRIWSWRELFNTAIHELKAPGIEGHPGAGLPIRHAVRAAVTRPDVWLPDPDQMQAALEDMQSAHAATRREEAQALAARAAANAEANRGLTPGNRAYHAAITTNAGATR